jgi:hypothetical protein
MGLPKESFLATTPNMKTFLEIGQRVAWKSGKEWKTGTILLKGDPEKNLREHLRKEFTLAYESKRENKKPHYYVAADTPLFKPGYVVHCVPAHHLQNEATSKPHRLRLLECLGKKELLHIALTALETYQRLKTRCPKELIDALHQINPESFPKPKSSTQKPPRKNTSAKKELENKNPLKASSSKKLK